MHLSHSDVHSEGVFVNNLSLSLCRTSLPDNIVQLGDPSTLSGVMNIDPTEPPEPHPPVVYPILGPEVLAEIFRRHQGNSEQM